MTATPNFASEALPSAGAADAAPTPGVGPFVLNLCSSTTPMALAQTDLQELKRFTFFVSRRFEEGRERFRLHMGYFSTLAEAEEWLNVVRDIYPGAWAGEAPGKKLRERAATAAATQAQHAAGPQTQANAPRVAAPLLAAVPDAGPPESLSMRVPVLQAAPEAPRAPAPAPRPVARPAVATPAPVAPAAAAVAAAPAPLSLKPSALPKPAAVVVAPPKNTPPPAPAAPIPAAARVATPPTAKPVPAMPALPAMPVMAAMPKVAANASEPAKVDEGIRAARKGAFGDSNVREVLQALGDASGTGETRLMRTPALLREQPVASPPPVAAPAAAPVAARNPLSDTQVLKLLETRRPEGAEQPAAAQDPAHGAIPLLKPDDTGTREALKDAVSSNAPVLFAVQLQWSVQAVELDKVPPLAIFSAYTLYTVEGSRDGRKWYGLRLGFFSDAISAKQVAHYVRSEFASVAVVPVSGQEKARATDQDKQAATLGGPIATPSGPIDEFKLLDDDTAAKAVAGLTRGPASAAPPRPKAGPAPAARPQPARPATAAPAAAAAMAKKIPGRPIPKVAVGRTLPAATTAAGAPAAPPASGARAAGKAGARDKRGAQSLEETLEILGAGQLSIDNGTGETLNESGVRHLRVEVQKNSPFSKLLERLSERMKKQ